MHSHADRLFKVWQYWRFRWRASGSANAKHIQLRRPGTKRFPKDQLSKAATLHGCCWSHWSKQNWEVGKSERNFAAWVILDLFMFRFCFSWKHVFLMNMAIETIENHHLQTDPGNFAVWASKKNKKSQEWKRSARSGRPCRCRRSCHTLWLWLTVCHGSHGPNRNRWFTELKNGGSFHGKLLVITRG